MTSDEPYNPLDRQNLAASVGEALLEKPPIKISSIGDFFGSGVYIVYYVGEFAAYKQISDENQNGAWQAPIYVGKAIPSGGRKGGQLFSAKLGKSLKSRLNEHGQSIRDSQNLSVDDFWCRYLIVEDIWIPLGENLMITKFSPIWNTVVDGFGNHTPGEGRFGQMRSRWDVLHPGRVWADRCKARPESAETIASEVVEFLRARPKSVKLFKS